MSRREATEPVISRLEREDLETLAPDLNQNGAGFLEFVQYDMDRWREMYPTLCV
jgi:hypothetical protein